MNRERQPRVEEGGDRIRSTSEVESEANAVKIRIREMAAAFSAREAFEVITLVDTPDVFG
jgi:hypothetical protein